MTVTLTTNFSNMIEPPVVKVEAWTTEDGDLVVYGTMNPREAQQAAIRFLAENGFVPGDEEWPEGVNHAEFFDELMKRIRWTPLRDPYDESPMESLPYWKSGRVPWAYGDPYDYASVATSVDPGRKGDHA